MSILELLGQLFSELNPKLEMKEIKCVTRDMSGRCNHRLIMEIGAGFHTVMNLNGDTSFSKFEDKILQNEVNKKYLKFKTFYNKNTRRRYGYLEATLEGIKNYKDFNGRE